MILTGRTCIYLDRDIEIIRNGNASKEDIQRIPISNIKNKIIYVNNQEDNIVHDDRGQKNDNRIDEKFDIETGNVFISGKLKGQLTIGAANNIYITATDPTNWYEDENKLYQNPPTSYPKDRTKIYGISYLNTTFSPSDSLSSKDKEKGIWTRKAEGKDMLGLIAQKDIIILHYGWPRYWNGTDNNYDRTYWNYKWIKNKKDWEKNDFTYDVVPYNITIHGALFAVTGGFGYEGYNKGGSRGSIILWGNITQYERKAVGLTSGTGYKKKYAHDPLMFYDYRLHVLEQTNVGWKVHDWKETNEHVEEK